MDDQENTQQQKYPLPQKRPLPVEQSAPTHYISNTEWGLVIGALAMVDAIQALLDVMAQIGVIANRFIDVFVGMSLALYKQLRCKNVSSGRWLMSLLITFIGEEIPDVDALPLWTLDGIYLMTLERAGEKLSQTVAKVPGGKLTVNNLQNRQKPTMVEPDQKNDLSRANRAPLPATNQRQPVQAINEPRKTENISQVKQMSPEIKSQTAFNVQQETKNPQNPAVRGIIESKTNIPQWQKDYFEKSAELSSRLDKTQSDLTHIRQESGLERVRRGLPDNKKSPLRPDLELERRKLERANETITNNLRETT